MIRLIKPDKIIIILCLVASVGRFALDSYLPSLPAIAFYFGNTTGEAEITLTLYLLGFGISQFFYGPLSDRFGRRPIILLSFIIFMLSGVLCTFADSLNILIVGRLLMGIGAGAGITLSRAIVTDSYEQVQIAKAWSQVAMTVIISLMISPLIGGYIQALLGWRYNFLIATLYALFVSGLLFFILPETLAQKNFEALKPRFILKSYLTLFRHKKTMGYILCYTLAFSGLMAYFQISPFLFIRRLHLSPAAYGELSIFIAASYFLAGLVVSRLGHKLGINRMLGLGIGIIFISAIYLFIMNVFFSLSISSVLIPSMIYVMGTRIILPSTVAGSLSDFKHMAGYAASFLGGIQMLGSALISYCVAQFTYKNLFLLGSVYFMLGIALLCVFYFIILKPKKRGALCSHVG